MRRVVALLQLCFCATALSPDVSDTLLTAAPGDAVLLPCYTVGNVTPSSTTWTKNGREVVGAGSASPSPAGQRLNAMHDGSLAIGMVILGDEGTYLCNSTLPDNRTFQARVQLQVATGPENVSLTIGPVSRLANGTLIARRSSTVFFNCSGASYPSQQLTWAFRGASSSNESLLSAVGSRLDFMIEDIRPSEQGVYICRAKNTVSYQAVSKSAQLLVYYVPDRPPECTCAVAWDLSQIQLKCTWFGAYPIPTLHWEHGQGPHNFTPEVTDSLSVTLKRSQLSNTKTLECVAEHPVLSTGEKKSCLFTVHVPDQHPDCMWAPAQDRSQLQFSCTWFKAFPTPKLRWEGSHSDQGAPGKGHVYLSNVTNNLTVTLNHSQLFNGQTLKCMAEHLLLDPGKEKSCLFTLKPPYPTGDPLATAVEATNVTLTCTENTSFPPANTTWTKGLQQEDIISGSKYIVSVEGPDVKLTIVNVSRDDEGVYFCRSENPLIVIQLEVYLTVKASSVNTGAIIGILIAVLILGSAYVVAKTIYSSRHQICLGSGCRQMGERGDVLNLVDSDDEQVFPDNVPQLPPITNGCRMTHVQIHRIPSSDHEDAETADTSSQQQEDTVDTEEPEDLVSF